MRVLVGTFVLFDSAEPGWALSELSGDIARLLQVSSPIRSDEVKIFHRGVKAVELSFTVSKPMTDEATVLEEMFWAEARIPDTGVIRIEGPRVSGGPRTIYFNGRFESVSVRHIGQRTFASYRLRCGKPRLISPSA